MTIAGASRLAGRVRVGEVHGDEVLEGLVISPKRSLLLDQPEELEDDWLWRNVVQSAPTGNHLHETGCERLVVQGERSGTARETTLKSGAFLNGWQCEELGLGSIVSVGR
jgi:hypothetical protein